MSPPASKQELAELKKELATIQAEKQENDARLLTLERKDASGTLVFSGRGIPRKTPGEKLIDVFLPIIHRAFNIFVPPSFVVSIRRENKDKRSPIVVQFSSSHSTGPYFDLLNPRLVHHQKKAALTIYRYQSKHDSDLKFGLKKIREAGIISGYRVNRDHLNMAQITDGGPYHLILTADDLLERLSQESDPAAYRRVSDFFLTGEMPPAPLPEAPAGDQGAGGMDHS